jgi:putative ABC transport system permease protein
VTTLTRPRAVTGNGGVPARRALMRWGWRLFRREWRQQVLVLSLLTVAVAATICAASIVTNIALPANYATFGAGAALVTLPGSDQALTADMAAIAGRWGPADVIDGQDIPNGTTQPVQLRAEDPHGHYNSPLLGLVSGRYPAGPGQVALTSQVASLYDTHVGGTWRAAGTTWRVTGIVQDPSNLADEFALVAPGEVAHPSQVTMLLGSSAVRQAAANGTLPGLPAAATLTVPNAREGGVSPATGILAVEVLGLAFIGLLSMASFSVMAQRRLRALGMLSAVGATERNLRLVMVVNGLVVGVAGALAGTVIGLAAWFAVVPTLQRSTGHVVDGANLPWWAFVIGVTLAIATSVLASRRPAKTMAAVPVVSALSGRPAPPRAVRRSAVPGVIVLVIGLAGLAQAGGLSGLGGGGHALFLLGGLIAVIVGVILLAPLAVSLLTVGAGPPLPVAIRIALRDLVRYRARSGAALAAATFAVFLAMSICVVASVRFDNPLNWIGPNLSSSQLVIYTQVQVGQGAQQQLGSTQADRLSGQVNSFAASLHAQSVPLELDGAVPYQVGASSHGPSNFSGNVYVATPQLLAAYGIKASQIAPGADILTMRPGLAGLPHLEMLWGSAEYCTGLCFSGRPMPGDHGAAPCTLSNDCLANPVIQTISSLPGGTSAPNTVITEYAVSKYHLSAPIQGQPQPQLQGWLIQAPAPLTGAQIHAATELALAYGVTVESKSDNPSLSEFGDGATVLGLVIALSVLAMSVGLIRSETAGDLRTLAATGASPVTRRTITAATAAALGLLAAILGLAGALVAGVAWGHSSLATMFSDVLISDALILLIGLPLAAAAGGWLLAGREPKVIARQPLE